LRPSTHAVGRLVQDTIVNRNVLPVTAGEAVIASGQPLV
jgi:hypothetical protein